jgi:hypothetical protein
MGMGASLFLVAIGAILTYAVSWTDPNGIVDIHTVGVILMLVGVLGGIVSALYWSSWGGWHRGRGML